MPSRSRLTLAGAILLALMLVFAGPAQAAITYGPGGTTGASILMGPATQDVRKSSVGRINITIDTKSHTINAFQFEVVFPDARLDCASIALTSTQFSVAATECTGNRARFAAGTPLGAAPFKGKARVATVTFKPTGVLGSANLKFNPDITMVVATPGARDVTGAMNTAVMRIVA